MASEEGSLPEGWRLQRDRLEGRRWRESSDGNRSLRGRREGVSRARAERPAYQLGRLSIAPSASWLMCPSVFTECHAKSSVKSCATARRESGRGPQTRGANRSTVT